MKAIEHDLLDQFGLSAVPTAMLRNRTTLVTGEIDDRQASRVVEELLYIDYEQPGQPATMQIVCSPGGSVAAAFAILDTARRVKGGMTTVGTGMVASAAALLLTCAGDKGSRFATKNCTIMIHQPLGTARGQETDVLIAAENLRRTRSHIEALIAEASGLSADRVHELCERDCYLTAEEALELGLIDGIIDHR